MTEENTFDPFAVMSETVKEHESNKGGSGNYTRTPIDQPEWFGFKDREYTPFRVIGNPAESRTEPWHAKTIMASDILTDNGYALLFVWQSEKNVHGNNLPKVDKDFFLYRLHQAIATKYSWDEDYVDPSDPSKKGRKVYEYINTDAGKRILVNHTDKEAQDSKFPIKRPFLPQARVVVPVWVDDDEWCVKNNHTKLITPKQESFRKKDGSIGYTNDFLKTKGLGIPYTGLYTLLDEKIVGFHGHWDIDILGWRDSECIKYNRPAYAIESSANNMIVDKYGLKVNTERLDPEFVAKLNHYNIDEMVQFKQTSYSTIQKRLTKLIKLVDALRDTTFEEELKDLVAEEKSRWEAEKKDKESKSTNTVQKPEVTTTQEPESVNDGPVVEAPKARQRQPVQTESKEVEWTEETIRAKCAEIYKYWEDLDNREKDAMIRGIIRFENDIPVIDPDMVTKGTYQMCGDDCKYKDGSFVMTEESISKCPACGTGYK